MAGSQEGEQLINNLMISKGSTLHGDTQNVDSAGCLIGYIVLLRSSYLCSLVCEHLETDFAKIYAFPLNLNIARYRQHSDKPEWQNGVQESDQLCLPILFEKCLVSLVKLAVGVFYRAE